MSRRGRCPKPSWSGFPEAAVRESTHRCERAMVNSGFQRPADRVVINLAPAELPKQAATFDLPISLGILIGSGQVRLRQASTSMPSWVNWHWKDTLAPPKACSPWRSLPNGLACEESSFRRRTPEKRLSLKIIDVIAVNSLDTSRCLFCGTRSRLIQPPRESSTCLTNSAQLRGSILQTSGVRKWPSEQSPIAAAGAHNLLMLGPPGSSGKTMLAKRIPTVLPQLTPEESIETTRIYSSACGRSETRAAVDGHTTVSFSPSTRSANQVWSAEAARRCQARFPWPTMVSCSLDELPEFNRRTLEVLRQPLGRLQSSPSPAPFDQRPFPCDFMLVAALNPCPLRLP